MPNHQQNHGHGYKYQDVFEVPVGQHLEQPGYIHGESHHAVEREKRDDQQQPEKCVLSRRKGHNGFNHKCVVLDKGKEDVRERKMGFADNQQRAFHKGKFGYTQRFNSLQTVPTKRRHAGNVLPQHGIEPFADFLVSGTRQVYSKISEGVALVLLPKVHPLKYFTQDISQGTEISERHWNKVFGNFLLSPGWCLCFSSNRRRGRWRISRTGLSTVGLHTIGFANPGCGEPHQFYGRSGDGGLDTGSQVRTVTRRGRAPVGQYGQRVRPIAHQFYEAPRFWTSLGYHRGGCLRNSGRDGEPHQNNGPVAQSEERRNSTPHVVGSSPTGFTKGVTTWRAVKTQVRHGRETRLTSTSFYGGSVRNARRKVGSQIGPFMEPLARYTRQIKCLNARRSGCHRSPSKSKVYVNNVSFHAEHNGMGDRLNEPKVRAETAQNE